MNATDRLRELFGKEYAPSFWKSQRVITGDYAVVDGELYAIDCYDDLYEYDVGDHRPWVRLVPPSGETAE